MGTWHGGGATARTHGRSVTAVVRPELSSTRIADACERHARSSAPELLSTRIADACERHARRAVPCHCLGILNAAIRRHGHAEEAGGVQSRVHALQHILAAVFSFSGVGCVQKGLEDIKERRQGRARPGKARPAVRMGRGYISCASATTTTTSLRLETSHMFHKTWEDRYRLRVRVGTIQ